MAERDIDEIYAYIAGHDSVAHADRVLAGIEAACLRLSELPHRGHVPRERRDLGIAEYREVAFRPYRIVPRILGRTVTIHTVLDGRRDMQTLPQERLTR